MLWSHKCFPLLRIAAASKLLPELKVILGIAFGLTIADCDGRPWDSDEKDMRERALRRVRKEKPMLQVGSPMCTAFSTWQQISNNVVNPVTVAAELKRAVMHLESAWSSARSRPITASS